MITSNINFGFGWKKEPSDIKDIKYKLSPSTINLLPTIHLVDLRTLFPPVYNQGKMGSCVANAIAGMVDFLRRKDGESPLWTPSRLYLYYWGRYLENTIGNDSGLYNRDGMKALDRWGICSEDEWPYIDVPTDSSGNFPADSLPVTKPLGKYGALGAEAAKWRIVNYEKIVDLASYDNDAINKMKGCLIEGYPFIFGIWVFSTWFDSNGKPVTIIKFPTFSDTCLGGHCMVGVGFDDTNQWFIARNSWGNQYGDNGYFYLPYQYMQVYSSDVWVGYHVGKEEFRTPNTQSIK